MHDHLQSPVVIGHRINAGLTFTGEAPVDEASGDVRYHARGRAQKFVEGTKGGLVDFGGTQGIVYRLHYSGPGSTEVEVFLEETDELAGVRATGKITCVAGASLVDGEIVAITTPTKATTVTFRKGLVRKPLPVGHLVVSDDMRVGQVRDALLEILKRLQPGFDGLLSGADSIDLVSRSVGTEHNVAITESVADAGFVVTGMAGGTAVVDRARYRVLSAIEQSLDPEKFSFEFGNFGIMIPPGWRLAVDSQGAIDALKFGEFMLVLGRGWQHSIYDQETLGRVQR